MKKCSTNNKKERLNCCGNYDGFNIQGYPEWTGGKSDWDLSQEQHNINNCYSYALDDKIEIGWRTDKLQPGEISDVKYDKKTCESIIKHVKEDYTRRDIYEIGLNDPIECNRYKIALVLSNNSDGFDYHFYRQDLNGLWSHKTGNNKISNVDASGNLIKDPKTADRNYNLTSKKDDDDNDYNIFCGYYSVKIDK